MICAGIVLVIGVVTVVVMVTMGPSESGKLPYLQRRPDHPWDSQ